MKCSRRHFIFSPLLSKKRTRGFSVFFIFMIITGCSGTDPMWKKIDIKTFLYTKKALSSELFSQNTVNIKSPENAILVSKVRNRTGMRVYVKMQYRDAKGNTSDVEILCSEFNPKKWTTVINPVQISAEDFLKAREGAEINLEPIRIETK